MLVISNIVGSANDIELSERLHQLSHHGVIETIRISAADTSRSRQRVTTDHGTSYGIALPRQVKLYNGAVLHIDEERAVVLRVNEEHWLRLSPTSNSCALVLGYNAGNLHWRVRFDGTDLLVALEGPAQNYLDRILPLIESGEVKVELPDGI
jgi:urease accessory protein